MAGHSSFADIVVKQSKLKKKEGLKIPNSKQECLFYNYLKYVASPEKAGPGKRENIPKIQKEEARGVSQLHCKFTLSTRTGKRGQSEGLLVCSWAGCFNDCSLRVR